MASSAAFSESASSAPRFTLGDIFREKDRTGDSYLWIIINVIEQNGQPGYILLSITGLFKILSQQDLDAEFRFVQNARVPLEAFEVSDETLQTYTGDTSWEKVAQRIQTARGGKRKADDGNTRRLKRRIEPKNSNTTNSDNADFVRDVRLSLSSQASLDQAAKATFTLLDSVDRRVTTGLDQRSIGWDRIPQTPEPKYSLGQCFRVNGVRFMIVAGGFLRNTFYYAVRSNRLYKGPFVISQDMVKSILGTPTRSRKYLDDLDQFDISPELMLQIYTQYAVEDDEEDDEEDNSDIIYKNAETIFLDRDDFRSFTAKTVQALDAKKLAERTGAPTPPEPPINYMLGDQFRKNNFGVFEYWLLIGGGELPADGAAATGEMYFDFISNNANILRCRKSEIDSFLGFRNRVLMTTRYEKDFNREISKFNLGTAQLYGFIENQRVTYQDYIRERLQEIYEANLTESNKTEIDVLTDGMSYLDWRFFRGVKPREEDGSTLPTEQQRSEQNNRQFRTPKGMSPSMFEQMIKDQRRRAGAYKILYDIEDKTDIKAIDARIKQEANNSEKSCSFCGEGFNSEYEDVDPGEKAEYLGKPVKLKCGHWYHINCLMKCQAPTFTNYNYNNGFGDFLRPIDTLKCILCRRVALDNSFGDGVYRFVNLRF